MIQLRQYLRIAGFIFSIASPAVLFGEIETVELELLGVLPSNPDLSRAIHVSDDGRVVVGYGGTEMNPEAFVWVDGQLIGLGSGSRINNVSGNGEWTGGSLITGSKNPQAVMWDISDPIGSPPMPIMLESPSLSEPIEEYSSEVTDLSTDGGILYVRYHRNDGLWNDLFLFENNTYLALDTGIYMKPTAMSSDGSVVTMLIANGLIFSSYKWENGSVSNVLEGEVYTDFLASGLSGNGSILAGSTSPDYWQEPATPAYTKEGLLVHLSLPNGFNSGSAQSVSDDGSLIVGYGHSSDPEAFMWRKDKGYVPENLNAFLDAAGVDRMGSVLTRAYAVSGDGSTLVGEVTHGDGKVEAFRMTIAYPEAWGSFPIQNNTWVNTGDWLGWINVRYDPWIWRDDPGEWVYIPAQSASQGTGWIMNP